MDLQTCGDDRGGLFNAWDATLLEMRKEQCPYVLGIVYTSHIHRHPQLQHNMAYYGRLPVGHEDNTYELLYRMVVRHLESQITNQARNEMT